ncbi:MAG TPA: protein kinase, partial [Myxococcales bacterium]|nr:protein kinase [Myxococcales bacterium]
GGMGVVYLAHDTQLDRKVAIKLIAGDQPEPLIQHYFENEARLLARLQHPNIVTVFRVGQVEGHPYIVSEYVAGTSLARLDVPLPWARVLALGIGLSRGLAAAHRQGVLHRDIKRSNAMETADGVVKLLDFGLAERIDGGAGGGASGPRAAAGTPRFMAPEVLGGAPATPRSDLYSLGLVLKELLPAPADPDLAAIVERCVRPDPEERFASADLLCEALERLAARVPQALSENPYRGLAPFEPEHQALFFGRDADIQGVLDLLRRQGLALVVADSGVGKSSLCRAGVLPRAAGGAITAGRPLATLVLTPGRRPIRALAAAFAPSLSVPEDELISALLADPGGQGRRLLGAHQREGALLLVDQLEELVTLSDPGEAACFARALAEVARAGSSCRLLLAVRGDFVTRIAALPGLGEEVERALYFLRPMTPEGLRAAVVGPARACGVTFESDALIQQLVDSAAHGPGELPLLSFALTRLWERRDAAGARITRAALDGMGGVAGLLSRYADNVVARLDGPQQEAARRLLIRLVTAEDTRGERTEDELEVGSPGARVALRALVDGRLLQARAAAGRVSYQIAHDALIQRWPLLRNWLDDDIGHRAVRQRLEAASAEWNRLRRPPELLWQGRQLEEVRPLDRSTQGPLERTFLEESTRRVRRRRQARWLAAALALLAVVAPAGILRLQARLADIGWVKAQLGAAREGLEKARETARAACARRDQALELFDRRGADAATWNAAEERWTSSLQMHAQAAGAYRAAERFLERASERELPSPAARQLLQDATYDQMVLEECFHPQGAGAEEVRRLLTRLDDEAWRSRVEAPAELQVVTQPAGARVEIERYVEVDGALRPEPVPGIGPLGPTPIDRLVLPAGSYRLRFLGPDGTWTLLPRLLARGARERIDLALPSKLPEGYAYVPPGWFLQGTDQSEVFRRGSHATPLHRVLISHGYLIGRNEVTFKDWLEYLETLPPGARDGKLLEPLRPSSVAAITLRRGRDWTFSFYRMPSLSPLFTAREGEDFRYPGRTRRSTGDWRRLPLTGISAEDLRGYLSWLDRSGRLPGARLCGEREWERAARGADARDYPGGNRLLPDDANFDATYGRRPDAYGPDVVGSHPGSRSPFDLDDLAANVGEMTVPWTLEQGQIIVRGGAWYYEDMGAFIVYRNAGEPTLADPLIGARLCASYPPG